MIREGFRSLHGFAWYVHRRPGVGSPGPGEHPFDGVESKYRPLCWPIGPGESGVRNRGLGQAFLIIMPTLTFGPPEVGRGWEVEPAELDDFRTEDGRGRLVGLERHRTRWGTVAECEFEEEQFGPRGTRDLVEPLDGLPDRDTAVIGVPGAVVMTYSAGA
jgi:hypothetical protein